MPSIFRQPAFLKAWSKLSKVNKKQARKAITLFLKNPQHTSLHDHGLIGRLARFRAFSVNSDIRIIYHKNKDGLYFDGIGSHDNYSRKAKRV